MYNYNTTNESFLELYRYLSDEGIKNKDMILTLNNKDLLDVNPWDTSLDNKTKSSIVQECYDNIWYFLREVVKLGSYYISNNKFIINIGTLGMIYLWMNGFNQMVLLPTMLYKTGTACVLYSYLRNVFGLSLSNISVKATSDYEAKLIKYNIGRWQTPSYLKSSVDKNNSEKHILMDNFTSLKNNKSLINKNINKDANIMLLATPGDVYTKAGLYAKDLQESAIRWDEHYLDADIEKLRKVYDKSWVKMFNVTYTPRELIPNEKNRAEYMRRMRDLYTEGYKFDEERYEREVNMVW